MINRKVSIWIAINGMVALDIIALYTLSHSSAATIAALYWSQSILLAFWCSMDARYSPWRILLWLGFSSPWHMPWIIHFSSSWFDDLITFSYIWGGTFITVLWILRHFGLTLINRFIPVPSPCSSRLARFQYPLLLLFEWMTAIAIIFSMKQLKLFPYSYLHLRPWPVIIGTGIITMLMLAVLWLFLGNRPVFFRKTRVYVYLLLALVVFYLIDMYIFRGDGEEFVFVFCFFLFGWLIFLRELGYRLEWATKRG
jgi:hypothetical protein